MTACSIPPRSLVRVSRPQKSEDGRSELVFACWEFLTSPATFVYHVSFLVVVGGSAGPIDDDLHASVRLLRDSAGRLAALRHHGRREHAPDEVLLVLAVQLLSVSIARIEHHHLGLWDNAVSCRLSILAWRAALRVYTAQRSGGRCRCRYGVWMLAVCTHNACTDDLS